MAEKNPEAMKIYDFVTAKTSELKLGYHKEYYLFADEGGMFGSARFIISDNPKSKDNFTRMKMKGNDIRQHIIGRLIAFFTICDCSLNLCLDTRITKELKNEK